MNLFDWFINKERENKVPADAVQTTQHKMLQFVEWIEHCLHHPACGKGANRIWKAKLYLIL